MNVPRNGLPEEPERQYCSFGKEELGEERRFKTNARAARIDRSKQGDAACFYFERSDLGWEKAQDEMRDAGQGEGWDTSDLNRRGLGSRVVGSGLQAGSGPR